MVQCILLQWRVWPTPVWRRMTPFQFRQDFQDMSGIADLLQIQILDTGTKLFFWSRSWCIWVPGLDHCCPVESPSWMQRNNHPNVLNLPRLLNACIIIYEGNILEIGITLDFCESSDTSAFFTPSTASLLNSTCVPWISLMAPKIPVWSYCSRLAVKALEAPLKFIFSLLPDAMECGPSTAPFV